jgi:hypothetical protein
MHISNLESKTVTPYRVVDRVLIAAPIDRVWQHTIDVNNWSEWCPTIQRGQLITDGNISIGSRFTLKQPMQAEKVWCVTELIDGRLAAWETDQPEPQFKAIHSMIERQGCIESTLEIEFSSAWKPIAFVISRVLALALARENLALKAVCEAR